MRRELSGTTWVTQTVLDGKYTTTEYVCVHMFCLISAAVVHTGPNQRSTIQDNVQLSGAKRVLARYDLELLKSYRTYCPASYMTD